MIIGIDLGTSYCSASYINAERIPTLVGDLRIPGEFRTPSFLALTEQNCFVGRRAEEYFLDGLTRSFVREPKWELGSGKSLLLDFKNRRWSAELVQAALFAKLRTDFLAGGHGLLDGAAVAISANFNDHQRRAVRRIGELIGVPTKALIDAPVAAARFLVELTGQPQNVLVCDFGSGAFEVSAVRYSENELSLLGTDVAFEYGTNAIKQQLAEHFKSCVEGHAKDQGQLIEHQLLSIAEQSMISICQSDDTIPTQKHFVAGMPIELSVSRTHFSQLAEPWIHRCEGISLEFLTTMNLEASAIDRILFIGGGSLIPGLVRRFCESLRIPLDRAIAKHPLHAVAYGTAQLAEEGRSTKSSIPRTQSASAFDLGIRIRDLRMQKTAIYKLIKRHTPLPAKASKIFKTSRIDQERMIIEVVQVKKDVGSAISLGSFSFGPLSPTSEHHPIEVIIQCDHEGLVQVSAKDLVSQKQVQHQVTSVHPILADSQAEDSAFQSIDPTLAAWALANLQS